MEFLLAQSRFQSTISPRRYRCVLQRYITDLMLCNAHSAVWMPRYYSLLVRICTNNTSKFKCKVASWSFWFCKNVANGNVANGKAPLRVFQSLRYWTQCHFNWKLTWKYSTLHMCSCKVCSLVSEPHTTPVKWTQTPPWFLHESTRKLNDSLP